MNDQQVNKTIAEFMDIDFTDVYEIRTNGKTCKAILECDAYFTFPCYTKSLDALVPVLKRLNETNLGFDYISLTCKEDYNQCDLKSKDGYECDRTIAYNFSEKLTTQQVAAYAVAKAIKMDKKPNGWSNGISNKRLSLKIA